MRMSDEQLDGNYYLNAVTGEIYYGSKTEALEYFKADGKLFGYEVSEKDLLN